jgi:hypothetical protein
MLQKLKRTLKEKPIYIIIPVILIILILAAIAVLLVNVGGEDVIDIDDPGADVDKPGIEDEFLLVEQPLGYYKNYEINIPDRIISEIGKITEKYSGFKLKDVNHVSWVENFLVDVGKGDLPREKLSPKVGEDWVSSSIYTWENLQDVVVYEEAKDTLFFRFTNPVTLSGFNLRPSSPENILKGIEDISGKYFSKSFEYKVDNISRHGNDYKIEYSRMLKSKLIYPMEQKPYLLITPDGRLREGLFLLVEFEEYLDIQYPLISGSAFKNNINTVTYPKHIEFEPLGEITAPFAYGEPFDSVPFFQKGTIQISEVEIVYPYINKSVPVSVPTFLFKGEGILDLEDEIKEANFNVLANAIDPKYVYIHPDSHFEMLESLE